ncbi:hypothetical protein GTW38_23215, partial [Streptomyces sp. SID7804]|nr:hypothetical protein [Streptomyces sp. SID7804]
AAGAGSAHAEGAPADPAERLLSELTLPDLAEDVRVPSPAPAREDADDAPWPLVSYAPFYGGPYVPVAVVDRHRVRVKS